MGGSIAVPVTRRLLVGYVAAVPVAAYSGVLIVFLSSTFLIGETPPSLSSLASALAGVLLTAALVGTVMLPMVLVAGLPALVLAWWLLRSRRVPSRWWFLLLGTLAPITVVWFLLPVFYPFATPIPGSSDPRLLTAAATGLAMLAPAGALAAWVFWRTGVVPVMQQGLM